MRSDTFSSRGEHFVLGRGQKLLVGIRNIRSDNTQHVLPRQRLGMTVINKVPLLRYSEIMNCHIEFLRREQLFQFSSRPTVKFSFVAFAIGILSRIKTPFGM